jgi:PAS domain S-box-containing protein
VHDVRRFVGDHLFQFDDGIAADVVLMTSELATNAMCHGGTACELILMVDPAEGFVRVEVRDEGGGEVVRHVPGAYEGTGRGLQIVDQLADSWGWHPAEDGPGKSVWFEVHAHPLHGADAPDVGAARHQHMVSSDEPTPVSPVQVAEPPLGGGQPFTWSPALAGLVVEGLEDALVVTDGEGVILFINPAAEDLFGWPAEDLIGHSAQKLVPESMGGNLTDGFRPFITERAASLTGRQLRAVISRRDGTDEQTELVLSVMEDPSAGTLVVGVFRPLVQSRLQQWSELTSELLELLDGAAVDDPPAERLLSTIGRQLRWDVTTLWTRLPSQGLVCSHVWSSSPDIAPAFVEEKTKDPTNGGRGLPHWVFAHSEPLWIPDLEADGRFVTDAVRRDGLQSAYAFPVRYRGSCVGVIKMLSRSARQPDPGIVDLMNVIGDHLGELLYALAQATEREHLVGELQEARRSQEFLLLATQVLSEATGYLEMVDRLAQVAVPVLADLCLIDVQNEQGEIERVAAWHADPAKRALTEELRRDYPPHPRGLHPSVEVLQTGHSRWDAEMTDEFLRATTRDERHLHLLKTLEFTSYMTVPLRVRDRILGTVTLVSAGSGRRFTAADLVVAEQLASQVASVVDRARAYDQERQISHDLQRNLLPDQLPQIEGWSLAARYTPGTDGVEVGGDWYDVAQLSNGSVALIVGDVEGHDMEAAKVMSRLRHVLNLLIWEDREPGHALARLNRYLLESDIDRIATVLVGVLNPDSGSITLASAGHPSPIAVGEGVRDLGVDPGPPIGVPGAVYGEAQFSLGSDCLVMFTDGLFERRGVRLDESRATLRAAARLSISSQPSDVTNTLLAHMVTKSTSDDIAILAVQRR